MIANLHDLAIHVAAVARHPLTVHTAWLLWQLAGNPGIRLSVRRAETNDGLAGDSLAPVALWRSPQCWLRMREKERQQEILKTLLDDDIPSVDLPVAPAISSGSPISPAEAVLLLDDSSVEEVTKRSRSRVFVLRIGGRRLDEGMTSIIEGIDSGKASLLDGVLLMADPDRGLRELWRIAPQIAPGDTGEVIFVRLLSEIAQALAASLGQPASMSGAERDRTIADAPQPAVPRDVSWKTLLHYRLQGRGRRAPFVLRRALT